MDVPWYYFIGAFFVLAWAAIPLVWIILKHRRGSGLNTDASDAIVTRLDAIDTRLAAVEKTLNDIP